MWLVKHCPTVLLGTFFSFLMISQVDFINSNYAVSENLINPPVVSLEKKNVPSRIVRKGFTKCIV